MRAASAPAESFGPLAPPLDVFCSVNLADRTPSASSTAFGGGLDDFNTGEFGFDFLPLFFLPASVRGAGMVIGSIGSSCLRALCSGEPCGVVLRLLLRDLGFFPLGFLLAGAAPGAGAGFGAITASRPR